MSVAVSKPVSVAEALALAVSHHQAGRLAEAERLYRAILAAFPAHPDAHHNLGCMAVQVGRAEEGLPHFKAALEAAPDQHRFWISTLDALLIADRVNEARTGLAQAAERGIGGAEVKALAARLEDAVRAEPLFARAVEQQRGGRLDQAIATYSKVLALRPHLAIAHLNLGVALMTAGKLEEAEAAIRRAIALRPENADAHYAIGRFLRRAERLEEAVASLRHTLTLQPDLEEAYGYLGAVLSDLGLVDEAITVYGEAVRHWPDHAHHWNNLGVMRGRIGEVDDAIAAFGRALAIRPDWADLQVSMGHALQGQCRRDLALPHYRRAAELAGAALETDHRVEELERVVALQVLGRSGSMFLHSLFDGHPEIVTLPGIYLKAWFDDEVWRVFRPDYARKHWRSLFAESVIREFEPMFDATSRRNVIGRPLGATNWMAGDLGFIGMGPDRDRALSVSRDAFGAALVSRLKDYDTVTAKDAFKLIHLAFDQAVGRGGGGNRVLFHHIHNPNPVELGGFLHQFPGAKLLYLIRNPVQLLESWMLVSLGAEHEVSQTNWYKAVDTFGTTLLGIQPPLLDMAEARCIRLEDIKQAPRTALPRLAEWMGISDHPALYDSSFCGLQYWGPTSIQTGAITGFSAAAINQRIGRLFGAKDVMILETLFWPFSRRFGYSDWDEGRFRANLREIRPWLDEPMQFERIFHARMAKPRPVLEEMAVYRRMRFLLKSHWAALDRDGDYPGMIERFIVDQR
jgi:tetratricopeptide (TPR) repeat protein